MINPFNTVDAFDPVADEARERAALADPPAPLVTYSVTDAAIASLREQYAGLSCDTAQGYESTRLAITHSRGLRGDIERRRVLLKADALAYGRRVDGEAKRITGLLLAVEAPLQANKDEVDNYKAQQKREKEEAEAAALEFLIVEKRAAEEARLKAIRDAEAAEIAAAREALAVEAAQMKAARQEADAIEAERRRQDDAERAVEAARLKTKREALDADRRAHDVIQEKAQRMEFERQAREQATVDALAKVERDRLTTLVVAAETAARLPDLEKARAWVAAVRAVPLPRNVADARTSQQLFLAAQDIEQVLREIDLPGLHELPA